VLAVPAHPLLEQVAAPLRAVAAGQQQSQGFPRPQGGTFFRPVILVHAIHQPVQQCLHGRRAVPGIDGRGQHDQIARQHLVKDRGHVVPLSATECRPVPLAGPAGRAGPDLQSMEPYSFRLRPQPFQLLPEGAQQGVGIALFSGTAHQNAHLHRIAPPSLPVNLVGSIIPGTGRSVKERTHAGPGQCVPALRHSVQFFSSSVSSRWRITAVWARVAEPDGSSVPSDRPWSSPADTAQARASRA